MRDSHVPFIPSSQGPNSVGQVAPMLQTPGSAQMQANTGKRPVGIPPLQPGSDGITSPVGCMICARAGTAQRSATQLEKT
jgi:hypothetical protein